MYATVFHPSARGFQNASYSHFWLQLTGLQDFPGAPPFLLSITARLPPRDWESWAGSTPAPVGPRLLGALHLEGQKTPELHANLMHIRFYLGSGIGRKHSGVGCHGLLDPV